MNGNWYLLVKKDGDVKSHVVTGDALEWRSHPHKCARAMGIDFDEVLGVFDDKRLASTMRFVMANMDSKKLSDGEFRQVIRNTTSP